MPSLKSKLKHLLWPSVQINSCRIGCHGTDDSQPPDQTRMSISSRSWHLQAGGVCRDLRAVRRSPRRLKPRRPLVRADAAIASSQQVPDFRSLIAGASGRSSSVRPNVTLLHCTDVSLSRVIIGPQRLPCAKCTGASTTVPAGVESMDRPGGRNRRRHGAQLPAPGHAGRARSAHPGERSAIASPCAVADGLCLGKWPRRSVVRKLRPEPARASPATLSACMSAQPWTRADCVAGMQPTLARLRWRLRQRDVP